MAKVEFELDHKGLAELLKSGQFAPAVDELARSVAAKIPGASVETYTTDRNAAAVYVPGGAEMQARDGVITRAAAASGLVVRSRP